MKERVRTKLFWPDPQCQHSCDNGELIHWGRVNSSVRQLRRNENIIGRGARSTMLQITDDRLSDLVLGDELLTSHRTSRNLLVGAAQLHCSVDRKSQIKELMGLARRSLGVVLPQDAISLLTSAQVGPIGRLSDLRLAGCGIPSAMP